MRTVPPDITRGHVVFCPTIGSSVAFAAKNVADIGATNKTEFGPFSFSPLEPQVCVLEGLAVLVCYLLRLVDRATYPAYEVSVEWW
jgi:hypothetical protein